MMTEDTIVNPIWDDQEAFIIGGGNSLRGFDWNLLLDENVIGCNVAFRLGPDICDVVIFGDRSWWHQFKNDLTMTFTGQIYTNVEELATKPHRRVQYLPRVPFGLSRKGLAWNGHTGASAINLAMLFGVHTVYLLGFDMGLDPITGQSNWHDEVIHPNAVLPSSYAKFMSSWERFNKGWKANFPDRRIINVSDVSNIPGIPGIGVTEFWTKRKGVHGQNDG